MLLQCPLALMALVIKQIAPFVVHFFWQSAAKLRIHENESHQMSIAVGRIIAICLAGVEVGTIVYKMDVTFALRQSK